MRLSSTRTMIANGWCFRSLTLTLGVALASTLWTEPTSAQTALRVPQDFPTITAAVDASSDGDTVEVAPGTYVENVRLRGRGIVLTSTLGPEVTIIDGSAKTLGPALGSCVLCVDGESSTTQIRGFTLTGGSGTNPSGNLENIGGGIVCLGSSPP